MLFFETAAATALKAFNIHPELISFRIPPRVPTSMLYFYGMLHRILDQFDIAPFFPPTVIVINCRFSFESVYSSLIVR